MPITRRLIDGAQLAAEQVLAGSGAQAAVLLVSCVGRREVLGDEIDDEIEAVRRVFPAGTPIAGFYSYGEIGPHGDDRLSELHNQSMTIASFSEVLTHQYGTLPQDPPTAPQGLRYRGYRAADQHGQRPRHRRAAFRP